MGPSSCSHRRAGCLVKARRLWSSPSPIPLIALFDVAFTFYLSPIYILFAHRQRLHPRYSNLRVQREGCQRKYYQDRQWREWYCRADNERGRRGLYFRKYREGNHGRKYRRWCCRSALVRFGVRNKTVAVWIRFPVLGVLNSVV